MTLVVHSLASDPDNRDNADAVSVAAKSVFVLDGAASLRGARFEDQSDAAWLTAKLGKRLDAFDGQTDFDRFLADALSALAGEAEKIGRSVQEDSPFTCLAGVIAHDDVLELVSWGDCQILVQDRASGAVQLFGYCSVAELDRQALHQLVALRTEQRELRHADAFREVRGGIEENRKLRNRLAGYQVINLEPPAVGKAERRFLPANRAYRFLLLSDGLFRAVSDYGLTTETEAISLVAADGVPALIAKVRAIEVADPDCQRHPRLKAMDDATGILVDWSPRP